jgi:hypothetical protein
MHKDSFGKVGSSQLNRLIPKEIIVDAAEPWNPGQNSIKNTIFLLTQQKEGAKRSALHSMACPDGGGRDQTL